LSVCFAAVFCIIISGALAAYATVRVSAPSFTLNEYTFEQFSTNDVFWKSKQCSSQRDCNSSARPEVPELTRLRLDAFDRAIMGEYRSGMQSLVQCLLFLMTGSLALWAHWRISSQARATALPQ
jgi:hypothetical protein